ncbi:uncharacterized protein METZ01_LOCUS164815, partial [marine metagenome]
VGSAPVADNQKEPTSTTDLLLETGEVVSCDLVPLGSNYTFLVSVRGEDERQLKAIYKPRKGEIPLWDFPGGTLHEREYVSYLLADALGWHFIPKTVLRDGPHGTGSVQLYVEHNPRNHYFTMREEHYDDLRRICLFDLLANNADRKAGHTLLGDDGQVWGIDHGLTFHPFPKLRTVIWSFADELIPEHLIEDLRGFGERFGKADESVEQIIGFLDPKEVEALHLRLEAILDNPVFPDPSNIHIPWPKI